ncbi:APC family permease [Paenibacillus lignilyticus]|uniref:Amino acid permease n=1 Tax=Paenibacillus lignilyticus TaxID=1172615 RepID=A0ABS5CBK9_9BACL|nr:amino acid permease [Paenibacillus lignilyticus]MBP3963355.1 amino acid permease [Paenibacillus lignilyticus]
MFLLWAGCLIIVCACGLSLVIARTAERGAKRSLHQSLHHFSPYVRYMQDKHDLNGIGFAQQLTRHMGGLSLFGLSFTSLSMIGGAVLFLGPALAAGGPAVIGFGWPVLTCLGIVTASSLAALASAIPTAGGCYHWALSAGGRRMGLWSGWLHFLGTILMLVTANLLLADWLYKVMETRLGYAGGGELYYALLIVLFLTQALLNVRGVHSIGKIAAISSGLQLVVWLAIILFFVAASWPAIYPFQMLSGTDPIAGSAAGNSQSGMVIGMLMLQRLFLGIDHAGQMAEETKDPRIIVPWSIFFSSVALGLFGFILFVLLMMWFPLGSEGLYAYSDIGTWFITLWTTKWGAMSNTILLLLVISFVWMNGNASVAAASRTLFAMARDEAVPFSSRLSAVSVLYRTPLRAVLAVSIVACVTSLVFKAVAAGAMTPQTTLLQLILFSVAALHIALALPIGAKLYGEITNRNLSKLKGPWNLGAYGVFADAISVCWLSISAAGAFAFMNPIVLLSITIAVLIGGLLIEWKYRALLKKVPFKVVGSIRFSRRSIDECIRIERKFPQH